MHRPAHASPTRMPRFLLVLLALAPRPAPAADPNLPPAAVAPARATEVISAADARFAYDGRFDFADRTRPVVIWQASRIRVDFGGETLALRFADTRDQCFFNAEVDGANTVIAVPAGAAARVELPRLRAGRHRLVLVKRSEAAAGTTGFRGIEIDAGAPVWAPAPADARLRLEFIGDSITAG